jgi:periplasmic protein TonB
MLSPKRLPALVASTAIVVGFAWALSTGLAQTLIEKLPDEIKINVLKEKIEKKEPPPPPPEMKAPPPPFVPPPDFVIQTEAPPPNQITVQSVVKTAPRLSAPFTIGKPHQCMQEYPAISVRLGEQGVTTVGFTITTEGSVDNVHVVNSSGSERLDNAAVSCVANWHYGPAKNDAGQPVAVNNKAAVVWKLK